MQIKLGLPGFGHVLRNFAELLLEKAPDIQKTYGIEFVVTGISTRSHGTAINPEGLDLRSALDAYQSNNLNSLHSGEPIPDTGTFIRACPADIILEATWLDPRTGQPALDYVRMALESGKHVVTANKGPVAFGYQELTALAQVKNLGFFYESTVMDGMPIHSMKRESLLAANVTRITGVLNSTTNYILFRMNQGSSFDEAVQEAQKMGVAEADPSNDIDGWDASIKTVILANTFMGSNLRPVDVDRTGIREITPDELAAARNAHQQIKLLCEAWRENGQVYTRVKPTALDPSHPFASLDRTASGVIFETDVLEHIVLLGGDAGPRTTAYGMLVDAINIARGRR